MALVNDLKRYGPTRPRRHAAVSAGYACFGAGDDKILQIITLGSETREHAGTTSQTIQFDRASAKTLYDILRDQFGFG